MKRFVVILLALCALWAALEAATQRAPSNAAARVMAVCAGAVLPCEREGVTLSFPDRSVHIDADCTALPYGMLFCLALLAYPAPWRRRSAALAVALAAIFLLDFARVLLLVHLRSSPSFAAVHSLSGAVFVAALLAGWIAWTRWSGGELKLDARNPAVAAAVALAFAASLVGLAAAQGPPPPPPPPYIPLGGAEYALAGIVGAYLLRRKRTEKSRIGD